VKIARVLGSVVSTAKLDELNASRLLIVQEIDPETPDGSVLVDRPFVVTDGVGAGNGELVLIAQGSAARAAAGGEHRPTDAHIVGILDSIDVGGVNVFRKS